MINELIKEFIKKSFTDRYHTSAASGIFTGRLFPFLIPIPK